MSSRRWVGGGSTLIAMFGVTFAALSLPAAAAASGVSTADAAVIQDLLPGATASTLATDPTGTGQGGALVITVPSSDLPAQSASPMTATFTNDELGWRAGVAACVVALDNPSLSSWSVSEGGVDTSTVDALHGSTGFGTAFSDNAIDSVPLATASSQLEQNLTTLQGVLPSGAVVSSSVKAYTINQAANQFALEADLTVASPSVLDGHYGDVIYGLETGLTGNVSTSPVEGLAVVVTASDGDPVVGSWQTTRAQHGILQFADLTDATQSLQPTTSFANETGGPTTVSGATGAAGGSRPGRAVLISTARAAGGPSPSSDTASLVIVWGVLTFACLGYMSLLRMRSRRPRSREPLAWRFP